MDKFLNLPLKIPRRSPACTVFLMGIPNGHLLLTHNRKSAVFRIRPLLGMPIKKTVIPSIWCDTCIEHVHVHACTGTSYPGSTYCTVPNRVFGFLYTRIQTVKCTTCTAVPHTLTTLLLPYPHSPTGTVGAPTAVRERVSIHYYTTRGHTHTKYLYVSVSRNNRSYRTYPGIPKPPAELSAGTNKGATGLTAFRRHSGH